MPMPEYDTVLQAMLTLLEEVNKRNEVLEHAAQWIQNADVAVEPGWRGSTQDILSEIEDVMKSLPQCKADGCRRVATTGSWCGIHYKPEV